MNRDRSMPLQNDSCVRSPTKHGLSDIPRKILFVRDDGIYFLPPYEDD